MVAERLSPQTLNTYLSLLGTILNAAVDDDYLPRSPLMRKSGAGRTAATRNQPVPRREVWLTREQLDRLVEAIDPRYRALVLVAALTGMRWGELAALRWDDPRFDLPLNDGAVSGPGRLRIARAISDPRRTGRGVEKGPKADPVAPIRLCVVGRLLDRRPPLLDPPIDGVLVALGSPADRTLHTPAQPVAQQRPDPGRMVADPGQPLDHDGDPVQRPQLPDKAVGASALQQGLLDLAEPGVADLGGRPGRSSAV
jgi:hypothetical protein